MPGLLATDCVVDGPIVVGVVPEGQAPLDDVPAGRSTGSARRPAETPHQRRFRASNGSYTGAEDPAVSSVLRWALVGLALVLSSAACASGSEQTVGVTPAAAAPIATAVPTTSPTPSPSVAADREVCIDLDARGGALYQVFIVPMLAGESGRKSIDVDIAQMSRAVSAIVDIDADALGHASTEVTDEGQRMVAAAQAMGMYDHAEGTALLTSFVGLAVACTKAGYQPSWFEPEKLVTT
jgi:hypothetical protein